jgi:hypothetical protein
MIVSSIRQERRKKSRSFLDLPVEIHVADLPDVLGGIVVDGSETGLLLHSVRDFPLGTKMSIAVLFPNGFELANFEASARIIRKNQKVEERRKTYTYGLKLVQLNEEDRLKLKYVLSGLHELVNADTFVPQLRLRR